MPYIETHSLDALKRMFRSVSSDKLVCGEASFSFVMEMLGETLYGKTRGLPFIIIVCLSVLLFFFQNCSNTDITQQRNSSLIDQTPDPNDNNNQPPGPDTNNGTSRAPEVSPAGMDGFALYQSVLDPGNQINPSYMIQNRNGPDEFGTTEDNQRKFVFSSFFFIDGDARQAQLRMSLASAAHSSWKFNPSLDEHTYSEASIDVTGAGFIIISLKGGDLSYPESLKSELYSVEATSTTAVITDSEWHNIHVVVNSTVTDGSNRIRLWIDGNPVGLNYTNGDFVELNSINAFTNEVSNFCLGALCSIDKTYFDLAEFNDAEANGFIDQAVDSTGPLSNYLYSKDVNVTGSLHGGIGQSMFSTGNTWGWTPFYDQGSHGVGIADVTPLTDNSFLMPLDSTSNVGSGYNTFTETGAFYVSPGVSYESTDSNNSGSMTSL